MVDGDHKYNKGGHGCVPTLVHVRVNIARLKYLILMGLKAYAFGPIVGNSNSTNNYGHWVNSKVVLSVQKP